MDLSFHLSRALTTGREGGWKPDSREEVLLRLRRKRAAAHRAGLVAQEQALREQILWSLPVIDPENHDD